MLARPPSGGGLGSRLRAALGLERGMDDAAWEAAEEALVAADLGPLLAAEVVETARRQVGAGVSGTDAITAVLRERLVRAPAARFELGEAPAVVLMVGVNGSGKTTTAAKLAARLRAEGRSVLLAAADTYRPGAIEQLRLWGDRLGVSVVAQRAGADPAAVAYDAAAAAVARGVDAVIVDTAGRLQTSRDLMAELAKIRRVISGQLPGQPRHVLLVLDATTGQNGLSQAETFLVEAGVTGIALAKLDGTAKGGVAVAIADRYGIPILFTAFGEELDTLAPFDADAYLEWLLAA
ncbi:MAG TPA: signal recognition particle-docking protein FtsY [Candidatus Limnocylindria bacterium]|nr:signal recognition particle-docking protein FtsY [Candidatus Limnocylindria bacterium]